MICLKRGSGSDIHGISDILWSLLYQLGMFAELGIIDRDFAPHAIGQMSAVPDEYAQKMARLVQKMEDHFLLKLFDQLSVCPD